MMVASGAYRLRRAIAALLATLGFAAASAPQNRVCFEHIGLQGKPMPEFCVAASQPAASTGRATVVVAPATVAKILSHCVHAPAVPAPSVAGVYRWTSDGKSPTGVIGPLTMLEIVNSIRTDAADRGQAVPEVIERLSLRLHV
jgi:hypothetical protein